MTETHYLSLSSRQEYYASCPRALAIPDTAETTRCEEYRISKLPLYAMFEMRGKKTEEQIQTAREKARCKLHARYLYMKQDGTTTRVCGWHLAQELETAEHFEDWTGKWQDRISKKEQADDRRT